jgi:hypothetical protein
MKIFFSESLSVLFFGASMLLLSSNHWSCGTSKVPIAPSADTIVTNKSNTGKSVTVNFKRGTAHNHPLMAIWTTDMNDEYIETLYIAKSIGKGVFEHGDKSSGKWQPGALRRPAALPVWSHSRNVQEADGLYIPTQETAMPDAVTGATPPGSFLLKTRLAQETPNEFKIWFEINQPWDWNAFWTNNKYPDDENYKTSSQPSLVYSSTIKQNTSETTQLVLVGHGHYNGKDGSINTDLSTITTAKMITESIEVKIE